MSRKGNCYDNAPMESFWGTLKQELTNHRHYRTRREAIQDITEYIEIFYRRQRRQPGLGFLSPVVYEQRYYAGLMAARKVWCPFLPSDVIASQTKTKLNLGIRSGEEWQINTVQESFLYIKPF